ncbi:MAG: 16S rRNA (adenine(1518)-N(6)/adenine(1519)-N(6))-dimethyltransferase RsmA [Spirochaetaceae bacterium]|nr:16S rRNA (adenine(1518)-N(6)/adenine(1519)-N(6))-dimethyltransferase RsmA [Spirochaetaceae bacterium]
MKNLPNYDSPAAINVFMNEQGLAAQKKFGQNFLVKRYAREKLIDALALPQEAEVWEIGPGLGAMTAELLGRGARVKAFEIDHGFCSCLTELFSQSKNFSLVKGNVLETWKGEGRAEFLLGNLPYNIAARIIGDFITNGVFFKRMALTVQREVARRMAAKPASPDYSSFSVLCSSVYNIKSIAVLKRNCFYPVPNVDSEGLCLELKNLSCREMYSPAFYRVVRALFASRRKTIKNNLLALVKAQRGDLRAETLCAAALQTTGIHPNERAENLSCEDFLRLTNAIRDFVD